jgi:hypothetical protein
VAPRLISLSPVTIGVEDERPIATSPTHKALRRRGYANRLGMSERVASRGSTANAVCRSGNDDYTLASESQLGLGTTKKSDLADDVHRNIRECRQPNVEE